MTYQFWRLSEAGPDNLGLACTDDGLLLGRTPLIERRDGRSVVRERDEIERLLKRAYPGEPAVDRIMPGLTTVASALNANDQCLARIAAVHLKIPDLPNQAARNALEAEDSLIKYARDGGGGSSDWNPTLHPRAGTPPNPGWFAPTRGASDDNSPRVRVAENMTRRYDQMHRLTSSTTGFTCHPPNASTNSAIFWNGSPTPNRKMNRQSARKSTATGEASATYRQSPPSITCCRECLNPEPRGRSGSKYSS